jgi:hypothetical protein
MEIYTPKESPDNEYRKEKKPKPEERVFPPRSELNEKLPIAEKWMLFVVGFLGFQLFGSLINTFINVFVKNGTISSGTGGALTLFISYLTIVLAFVLLLVFDRERNIIPYRERLQELQVLPFRLGRLCLPLSCEPGFHFPVFGNRPRYLWCKCQSGRNRDLCPVFSCHHVPDSRLLGSFHGGAYL